MLPGLGRALGETVTVTMTCGFALGATPGAGPLAFAPAIVILGLVLIAYPRRNAG
jgi:ABC-type phosphate transport system permease subunit